MVRAIEEDGRTTERSTKDSHVVITRTVVEG